MKYLKAYLWIFITSFLTTYLLTIFLPKSKNYLIVEDGLIENLSAIFFLISFFIGLLLFFISEKYRKTQLIISAIGLLGFLDELSFGQRFFEINFISIHGVQIDAVHDLFDLGFVIIRETIKSYPIYSSIIVTIFMFILIVIILKYRFKIIKAKSYIYQSQPIIFALIFLTLIFIALLIDLHLVNSGILFVIEELFEMNAAIVLSFCSISLFKQQQHKITF